MLFTINETIQEKAPDETIFFNTFETTESED